MKRFLAITISVFMLISVLPLAVFAEIVNTDPIKLVDADGNDVATYAELQDAYDAVAEGQKIVITQDITLATWLVVKSYDKDNLRNIVIEGVEKADGTRVKITTTKGFTDQLGLYNLTVRNLEIVNTASATYDVFMYDPYFGGWVSDFTSPTLAIDNCVISSEYGVFKFMAQPNNVAFTQHNSFIVNIKDSTITAKGGTDRGIGYTLWNTAASVDMDIRNSILKLDGGRSSSGNFELSHLFTHQAGGQAATFNMWVDGTSKLIANVTNTDNAYAGIFYGATGSSNITLENGAELYVDSGENKTNNNFIWSSSVSPLTITDKGAIYKVSATTVKNGITLPIFLDEHGVEHLWKIGNIAVANPYTDVNATSNVILTHVENNDPALNPNNVAYTEDAEGNKTYYTTLEAAAAQAPSGSTIILMKDATTTSYVQTFGKNLTIDGNNHKIEKAGDGYVFDINKAKAEDGGSADFSFTLKNATVNGTHFLWCDTDEINVENCTITTTNAMMFSVAPPTGVDTVVSVKDSTLTMNSTANEPFFRAGGGTDRDCDITWNIQNTDISITAAKLEDGGDNARSCVNMFTGGMVIVNMDGTSSMVMNGQYMRTMFYGHNATGGLALNLADGAIITVKNCSAGASIITANMSEKTVVVDNGANWVIGADAAKAGVVLPSFDVADATVLGFSDGIALYAVGATYQNAEATEEVTLTLVTIADDAVTMLNGAGLKTEGTLGVSFGMTISDELLAIVGENATYGILIAPVEYVLVNLVPEDMLTGQYIDLRTDAAGLTDGDGAKSCILGIKDFPAGDGVFLELCARGYVTYEADGEIITYYTNNTVEVSLYELAQLAAANGYADNANVKTILDLAK